VSPEPPYLGPVKSEASERTVPLAQVTLDALAALGGVPGALHRDLRPHGPVEPEDAHGPAGVHHLGRRAGDPLAVIPDLAAGGSGGRHPGRRRTAR